MIKVRTSLLYFLLCLHQSLSVAPDESSHAPWLLLMFSLFHAVRQEIDLSWEIFLEFLPRFPGYIFQDLLLFFVCKTSVYCMGNELFEWFLGFSSAAKLAAYWSLLSGFHVWLTSIAVYTESSAFACKKPKISILGLHCTRVWLVVLPWWLAVLQ